MWFEKLKQRWKALKKWWQSNHKRQYMIICSVFITAFVVTLGMGMTHRYDKPKHIMPIGKGNELSGNKVFLTKRIYNPEKHLYRLDFYVTSDSEGDTTNQYSADHFSVKNVSPKDPSASLPTKLIRVTPQYYVMYVQDVPSEEMRTDVKYKASFADGTESGSGEEETLKVYSSKEKGTKVETTLTLNTNEKALKGSAIDYDMTLIKAKQAKIEKDIKKAQSSSTATEKEVKSIQSNLEFKVGEEKQQDLERLNNLKNQQQTIQDTIQKDKTQLEEYDKQLLLLKEQKTLSTGENGTH